MTLGVIAILAVIGATLAAHFGVFGHGAQSFLNNKILSPIRFGMTSKLPAWTVPAAVGGLLGLAALGYGVHRRYQAPHNTVLQDYGPPPED